ncbi:MAG: tRNA epoxyqueuosine(34) reductase QueG [Kordiimonas sp.]|nr:tRNA epoxyqueuosine(34) reductase QueG [Kordiimonas sp.]
MTNAGIKMTTAAQITADIRDTARRLGFDAVGITHADNLTQNAQWLQDFLNRHHYGDMDWMQEKADRRADPKVLWPDVKSIIMLAMNYGPSHDPRDLLAAKERGNISVYARGKDYHDVIKKRLKQIARHLVQHHHADVKVFVDTAPVMEKPLAANAGLGWQGKHTNMVSRHFGSWLFLGCIYTTLDLPSDDAHRDHCGQCHACLDICPTHAFPAPYKLDARRCISYLTIEHKGHIPREFRNPIGNRIYGCDDCLAVCPWNKYAQTAQDAAYFARAELQAPRLGDLARLDDVAFRQIFAGSPIKRLGRDRFIRNVLIAIGNSQNLDLLPAALSKLRDDSPLVRAMAVWALGKLIPLPQFNALRADHLSREVDPAVRQEWFTPEGPNA